MAEEKTISQKQREYHMVKSDDMQDIIGSSPRWFIRYGITVFLVTMALVVGFSFILRFDERLTVPVSVAMENNVPVGELIVEQKDFSLLHAGQEVNITLFAYPAEKYGTLKGRLSSVSYSPQQQKFIARVQFNDQSGMQLYQGLAGSAEVVYGNKTLIKKILN
jgi:hypothetical protein